ncbi:MAG: PIG-L family deacetylase [Bernardetiaceae bacterium]|nr:PIG-L family deacetylase [Bernardetiaceae bacterium]
MQKKLLLQFVILLLSCFSITLESLKAQSFPKASGLPEGEIRQKLLHLQTLGSVLYIAAHPDDENTRLLAYLAQDKGYQTHYLSLTRGDGGQNLIGSEKGATLGLIRTQELLAARRIDGAKQVFSRANDFGYSKTPEETLEIWDKDAVLADMVRCIRTLRPDVLITRFSPTRGGTHGHHTASAQLAMEAFDAAADPKQFAEQLEQGLDIWQPKRLYWNISSWFFRDKQEEFEKLKPELLAMNIGTYNPFLGKSYGEIAGESRSMHKSQGFGAARTTGDIEEYLQLLKGKAAEGDMFDQIATDWTRVPGGEIIGKHLEKAYEHFDIQNPKATVSSLQRALKAMQHLKADFYVRQKKADIEELIQYLCGLHIELLAKDYSIAQGDTAKLELELINRSAIDIKLLSAQFSDKSKLVLNEKIPLSKNKKQKFTHSLSTQNLPLTQPYWLEKPPTYGMFEVENPELIGKPENDATVFVDCVLEIEGIVVSYRIPAFYKWTDPVEGELHRQLEILPPLTLNFSEPVLLFKQKDRKQIKLRVKSHTSKYKGAVRFELHNTDEAKPTGEWKITPEILELNFDNKNEEQTFYIEVEAPNDAELVLLSARLEGQPLRSLSRIEYQHIPTQTLLPEATVSLRSLELKTENEKIGYIQGAGDEIPEALRQVGYEVEMLDLSAIDSAYLQQFDAIITGVRAYNTQERLVHEQAKLLAYVAQGGTLIVQYNTSHALLLPAEKIAPYQLVLSRDRVTVEDAKVSILEPEHAVFHYPNKISDADFEGWVQERGLYFPNEWDETHFTALLSCHDPEEPARKGGLLLANYGKGTFIYTGYSWFRQLPAGVSGAYRIFANLIAGGHKAN